MVGVKQKFAVRSLMLLFIAGMILALVTACSDSGKSENREVQSHDQNDNAYNETPGDGNNGDRTRDGNTNDSSADRNTNNAHTNDNGTGNNESVMDHNTSEADHDGDTANNSDEPASSDDGSVHSVQWTLERKFANLGFQQPLALIADPLGSEKLYVVEQPGRIYRIDPAQSTQELFLDIRDRVYDKGWEQGLLGLAFHPDYQNNGYFFVNYTTSTHTHISRFQADPEEKGVGDKDSEVVLLTYRQPFANHNGGDLHFGPDGMLYISSGDGGSAGDPHNHSQNLKSLLGKLLRIDVDREEDGRLYGIPEDNPFAGDPEAAPEIYAYGLRNPWRFSFDSVTGELWVADVGQDELEEINVIESGGNYGWRIKEGTQCYQGPGCERDDLIDPVFEYDHSQGRSITGGYVYRGSQLPELTGKYVYADFVSGNIWALERKADGTVENALLTQSGKDIASFGVDRDGELYVLTLGGEIYLLTKQ